VSNPPPVVNISVRLESTEKKTAAHPIVRNTFFLAAAQIVGLPTSILTNAVTARYLGPAAYGYLYGPMPALSLAIGRWQERSSALASRGVRFCIPCRQVLCDRSPIVWAAVY
jgi:hypothetical protein